MSTIRKAPYIEGAIALLSSAEKSTLISVLNASTPVSKQVSFSNLESGINAVIFTFPNGEIKNGILINITDLTLLICYSNEQTLEMYKLNATYSTYEKVDEYLDINELRRILVDASASSLTPSSLTSILEGSEYISVDLNQAETKVVVELDETNLEDTPTENSDKLLTSGGVYDALADKQDVILDSTEIVVNGSENKLYLENNLSNKIAKALVTPASAPVSEKLVGVDTSNAQEMVSVGGGLGLSSGSLSIEYLPIITTAPSSANTDGLKIVVLSSEPQTKYDGYLYIITEV